MTTSYIHKYFCIPIKCNNPIKACLSNKKYTILIQIRLTQIEKNVFLIGTPVLIGFKKMIGVQSQLPISFGTVNLGV